MPDSLPGVWLIAFNTSPSPKRNTMECQCQRHTHGPCCGLELSLPTNAPAPLPPPVFCCPREPIPFHPPPPFAPPPKSPAPQHQLFVPRWPNGYLVSSRVGKCEIAGLGARWSIEWGALAGEVSLGDGPSPQVEALILVIITAINVFKHKTTDCAIICRCLYIMVKVYLQQGPLNRSWGNG